MAYGWTKEAEEYLVNNYGKMKQMDIAYKLGKSRSAITMKVRMLQEDGTLSKPQNPRRTPWSDEDEKYLVENYANKSILEISITLKRPYATVQRRVAILKKANPEKHSTKVVRAIIDLLECPECHSKRVNIVGSTQHSAAKYFCINCLKEFDKYGRRVSPML